MIKIVLIIAVILFLFFLGVGIIDGNRFIVVRESFQMPHLRKECKFVLISDLHNKVYGNQNDKVIEAIRAENPDFIVIAGDLVTSRVKESIDPGVALMNRLSKEYKIYYGLGNHETKIRNQPEYFGDKYDKLVKGIAHKNVTMLVNEQCILPEYNICLTGLELEKAYFARFRKRKLQEQYFEEHIGAVKENMCNILVAHNPDYFEEYAAWGADLVLSGHVHGGIMRLPLLGGVLSPSYTFFPKYDGGIFREGSATMLLGRGMGSHTLPFRFFNPAELYIVTLQK